MKNSQKLEGGWTTGFIAKNFLIITEIDFSTQYFTCLLCIFNKTLINPPSRNETIFKKISEGGLDNGNYIKMIFVFLFKIKGGWTTGKVRQFVLR